MADPAPSPSADNSYPSPQIQQNVEDSNQVIAQVTGGNVFGNITANTIIIGQQAMPILDKNLNTKNAPQFDQTDLREKDLPSELLLAIPGINSLQDDTIKLFLKKANDLGTLLYENLRKINEVDGRNPKGIFPKILTDKDIQVVMIGGQNQFGRYCSRIESKPGHLRCSKGIAETYLILIPAKIGVHKAVIYQPFLFTVKTSKEIVWYMNEDMKEYNYTESIEIDEPNQVFMNEQGLKL
jgi:hypothetical protein